MPGPPGSCNLDLKLYGKETIVIEAGEFIGQAQGPQMLVFFLNLSKRPDQVAIDVNNGVGGLQ